jgi:imidazolonepropionase-like amidohydrolase
VNRPLSLILLLALSSGPLSAQDLVLTNANVVDVTSGSVRTGVTVVVSQGRIRSIGSDEGMPSGSPVVDLGGMYLSPGLIDAHVHVNSVDQARRALESGVTTMRSMGSGHYADVGLRELGRSGHLNLPEYLAAGYHVRPTMAEGFFLDHPDMADLLDGEVRGEEAIARVVNAQLDRGLDFIKTNATERAGLPDTDPRKQLFSEEELGVMVREASRRGIAVAAHAHGDAGGRAAVEAGVRSIEHGTYLSPETLGLMAERGTFLVPTIAIVADLTIPGGDYDSPVLNMRGRHMLPRVREMASNAHRMGVPIVAATDTGYGPDGVTRMGHELQELVGVGLSPLEALRAGTLNAALLLGLEDRTGRIQEGFEADLVVTERNPLEEIGALQDILLVVNNGIVSHTRGDWFEASTRRPVS